MRFVLLSALVALPLAAGCVNVQPPTDTGNPVVSSPTSPSSPGTSTPTTQSTPLAYTQDMKALFADCTSCHGASRADGNYRMTTYAQVMTAVKAGSAASKLVSVTQQNGSMYRYWSGSNATRQAKAAQVRSWVVDYNAQENR